MASLLLKGVMNKLFIIILTVYLATSVIAFQRCVQLRTRIRAQVNPVRTTARAPRRVTDTPVSVPSTTLVPFATKVSSNCDDRRSREFGSRIIANMADVLDNRTPNPPNS